MESINLNTFLGFRPDQPLPIPPCRVELDRGTVWVECGECMHVRPRNLACQCPDKLRNVSAPRNLALSKCHLEEIKGWEMHFVNSKLELPGRMFMFEYPYLVQIADWVENELYGADHWASYITIFYSEIRKQLIVNAMSGHDTKRYAIVEYKTEAEVCAFEKELDEVMIMLQLCGEFNFNDYCCDKLCFKLPIDQVDGVACKKCENFSYCTCLCETFREKRREQCVCMTYFDACEGNLFTVECDCNEWQSGEEPFVVPKENAPHENQQENVIVVKKAIVSPISAPTLITPSTTSLSDDAMDDVEVIVGTTTSRVVSEIDTPSGRKTVIHMTNDKPVTLNTQRFLPSVPLSEWGNVWGTANSSAGVFSGTFSQRTKQLMSFFKFYNTLVVWRIIGKAPLFASRRYWVSYVPDDVIPQGVDNLGFEWNPSEESEIYVVTPWTSTERVHSVDDIIRERIQITPICDMVYAEGLPTDLNLDVYVSPYNMTLYLPSTVGVTTPTYPPKNFDWVKIGAGNIGNSASNSTTWSPVARITSLPPSDIELILDNAEGERLIIGASTTGVLNVGGTAKPSLTWTLTTTQSTTPSFIELLIPVETVSYQINEYSYNDNWKENTHDYGHTGDHTTRIDKHWSLLSKVTFTASDVVKTLNLASPLNRFAFSDLFRHLMYAKQPIIKIFSTSIPSANMLFRITQVPVNETDFTLGKMLQLPGVEFDPKEGPVVFRPYWDGQYPAKFVKNNDTSSQQSRFVISRLGGTMGVEPIEMSIFYNTSSMEYHHLSNEDPELVYFQSEESDPIKTSIQKSPGVDNLVNSAADSERRWTYLTSLSVASDVVAVQLPINGHTFGHQMWHHLRRYSIWRGTPHFKVVTTNSALVNSNLHVIQTDSILDSPITADKILTNIGYSTKSAQSGAIEYSTQWRTQKAYLPVDDNSDDGDLGFLTIVLPINTAADDETLKITIYVDPTDVEMKAETGPNHVSSWKLPTVRVAARDTAVSQRIRVPATPTVRRAGTTPV